MGIGFWWNRREDPLWLKVARFAATGALMCTAIIGWIILWADLNALIKMDERRQIRNDVRETISAALGSTVPVPHTAFPGDTHASARPPSHEQVMASLRGGNRAVGPVDPGYKPMRNVVVPDSPVDYFDEKTQTFVARSAWN